MDKVFARQILPILLAIGLLWYVLKDVPLAQLAEQFHRANYRWLFIVAGLTSLYFIVRPLRWRLTLQALGYHPSFFRTTVALLAGTMASMIVPGAGELTRCGTLQRTDGVPLAQSLGSVVAERVIDVIMLIVLVGLTFLFEFKRVGQYITNLLTPVASRFTPEGKSGINLLISGLLLLAISIALIFWLVKTKAFQEHRWVVRAVAIGRNIGKGFLSIRQLKRPKLFIALTIGSYVLSFSITYALFFASAQTVFLPPTAALTVLTVSSLGGLAVPTQGGLGTYHFLVSRVLILYGMKETDSVIVATFMHAIGFGINLLLSSVSFLIIPFLLKHRSTQLNKQTA
ncbi:lysylphosphatidylglycerol synthase transmembrane domain-containing protein [Spirosoma fluminis]